MPGREKNGQQELAVINKYYKPANVQFNLKLSEKVLNDSRCATTGLEDPNRLESVKKPYRKGGPSVLTVLYLPTPPGGGVKGWCIQPEPGTSPPKGSSEGDGCAVAMDTLPGKEDSGYNRYFGGQNGVPSQTTVHEIGHYLGLAHTSQSSGGMRWRQVGGGCNIMEPVGI